MDSNKEYTIVHIDDDAETINLVKLILAPRRFKVVGAANGEEGLAAIRRLNPDLVLLDLMMPDLDGWEVYHQIRAIPEFQDIPVIVITARNENIDRVLGLHIAKVDAYITKPFRGQELTECIDKVIPVTD